VADERTDNLAGLAFELSLRTLSQQEKSLDELRSRTGVLLTATALVTSFLGARALQDPDLRWFRHCRAGRSHPQHPAQCLRPCSEAEPQFRDSRCCDLRVLHPLGSRSRQRACNARLLESRGMGREPSEHRSLDHSVWHRLWWASRCHPLMVAQAPARLSTWPRTQLLHHLHRLPRRLGSSPLKPGSEETRPVASSGKGHLCAFLRATATA